MPFVYETSNNRWQRFSALIILLCLISLGLYLGISSFNFSEAEDGFVDRYIPDLLHKISPQKQFVISVMSGIIIFPIPNEVPFIVGLRQGNNPLVSVVATVSGFIIGNMVSYLIGLKLSKEVVYLLSTRKIYQLRRKMNRYGAIVILLANIIPSPSDILTFGLGMVRYNFRRLLLFLAIANLVKFSAMAYIITAFP